MIKYAALLLLLVGCGKDSDVSQNATEIVDDKSGYSCVYIGKSKTGGLFGSPVTTYDDYQCEHMETKVQCKASISEDGKNKLTFCNGLDWTIFDNL
jgi:hypothetical protein